MANLDRLYSPTHFAVRADLNLPDALQVHPRAVRMPAGAITIFGPFNSVEPTAPLEPRIANLPTGFDPSEESIEGFVEPAQRSLLAGIRPHGHIRSHTADLRRLGRLIRVPDPGLAMHPAIATFLQGRIVELAVRLDTPSMRCAGERLDAAETCMPASCRHLTDAPAMPQPYEAPPTKRRRLHAAQHRDSLRRRNMTPYGPCAHSPARCAMTSPRSSRCGAPPATPRSASTCRRGQCCR